MHSNIYRAASDTLVLQQYHYYRNYLPRTGHDQYIITSLWRQAKEEALRRGILQIKEK